MARDPRVCLRSLAALLVAVSLSIAGDARAGASASGGETRLALDPSVARDLGLRAAGSLIGAGERFAASPGSALDIAGVPGDFEGFTRGELHHPRGFGLYAGGEWIDLDPFDLAPGVEPLELELRDATGRAWLLLGSPHVRLAGGTLAMRKADLLIAPALADLLGRPELARTYVGVAEADWPVGGAAALDGGGAGSACDPNAPPPIDLALTGLASVTQKAREPGGRVAISLSAVVMNVGSASVPWNPAIEPEEDPPGPHPYLALALYRLADGVLEQVGRADVKHAFFAVNSGCDCFGGHILYAECSDVYGVNTNADRYNLGPRDEVTASSGAWTSLGSHFDGTPVDNVRDHFEADHDEYEHRLVVQEAELETSGARYFVEGWYLTGGDVSLLNSLGHREVDPGLGGGTWGFPFLTNLTPGSILDEFVNPVSPAPGEASELLDTGEGHVQLAVRTTALGGGHHRYEYALMNFDFDRRIRSFSLPRQPGLLVSAPAFRDGDEVAGNDWSFMVEPDSISFGAPPGEGLDWGELVSFGFDASDAPETTDALLEPLEGSPAALDLETLGPSSSVIPSLSHAWRFALALALLGGCVALARARHG